MYDTNWRFPPPIDGDFNLTMNVVEGDNQINLPDEIVKRFRNISIEVNLFKVTPADEGVSVKFYFANNPKAFDALNATPIAEATIDITDDLAKNETLTFSRQFKNVDCQYIRLVLHGTQNGTAETIVDVAAGGARQ